MDELTDHGVNERDQRNRRREQARLSADLMREEIDELTDRLHRIQTVTPAEDEHGGDYGYNTPVTRVLGNRDGVTATPFNHGSHSGVDSNSVATDTVSRDRVNDTHTVRESASATIEGDRIQTTSRYPHERTSTKDQMSNTDGKNV